MKKYQEQNCLKLGEIENMEKAIIKIKEEMENNKENAFVAYIGNYILTQVEINSEVAKKIIEGKKTILGSLKVMEAEAKKKLKGNSGCVCIDPLEGLKIVSDYFGFEVIQHKFIELEKEEIEEDINPKEVEKSNVIDVDFNVSLDDFLEG